MNQLRRSEGAQQEERRGVAGVLGPRSKFALLASLYMAQGVPFGFFSQALPAVMRQQNYSLELIGLSSLLALPWALKWIWAPLLDRYYWTRIGRRRSWLLPLLGLTVVLLLALALLAQRSAVGLLLLGCFLTNLLAATSDVATDGMAVEVLSKRERGLGNGIQVGAYRLGMILGGGVLVVVLDGWGFSLALSLMALVVFLAAVPVFLWQETTQPARPLSHPPGVLSFLRRPGVLLWASVLVVFKAGDAVATGMYRPFLIDTGLTLGDLGWLMGAIGSATGLLGALAGGLLVNRLGRRNALLVFGLLSAASVAGYALAATFGAGITGFAMLSAVEHFTGGMATVALFATMMDFCRRGSEGSDYTLQASIVVLATGGAYSLSGFSAARLGYAGHFWSAAALAVLCAVFAWWKLPVAQRQWAAGDA